MVDLPEPEEPTSAVTLPGTARKLIPWRTRLFGLVGEFDIFKLHRALDRRHLHGSAGDLVFFEFGHDFTGTVETGERFGKLRADIHDLKDRGNHEGEKHVVAEIVADRPGMAQNRVPAEPHHERRHQAEHGR